VVPADELDSAVEDLALTIAGMSPLVIRTGKQAFYAIDGLDEPEAYACAVPIMTGNALAHDAQEGISAFLQKRPPRWSRS
jgi:enoyl-CoA hydratase/carnithine racemase